MVGYRLVRSINGISHRASTRGTAVHAIIEKYINNEENFKDGYTPDIIGSFLDLKPILDGRIGRVYAQEAPLYSNHLGVAGRVDCVADFDGKLSIIDFKTSMKPKRKDWITNYFMQESAYAIMWEERTGRPITQLVTIISVDNHDPQRQSILEVKPKVHSSSIGYLRIKSKNTPRLITCTLLLETV